jgi:hypothetical protein
LLAKNACSPLEKVNSSEQSRHVRVRSWYTLSRSSCGVSAPDGVTAPEGVAGSIDRSRRPSTSSTVPGAAPELLTRRIAAASRILCNENLGSLPSSPTNLESPPLAIAVHGPILDAAQRQRLDQRSDELHAVIESLPGNLKQRS